jgi:hypothetical protein
MRIRQAADRRRHQRPGDSEVGRWWCGVHGAGVPSGVDARQTAGRDRRSGDRSCGARHHRRATTRGACGGGARREGRRTSCSEAGRGCGARGRRPTGRDPGGGRIASWATARSAGRHPLGWRRRRCAAS